LSSIRSATKNTRNSRGDMNSLLDDHSPTNACDRMSFEVEKEEMRLRGFSASNLVL